MSGVWQHVFSGTTDTITESCQEPRFTAGNVGKELECWRRNALVAIILVQHSPPIGTRYSTLEPSCVARDAELGHYRADKPWEWKLDQESWENNRGFVRTPCCEDPDDRSFFRNRACRISNVGYRARKASRRSCWSSKIQTIDDEMYAR